MKKIKKRLLEKETQVNQKKNKIQIKKKKARRKKKDHGE